MNNSSFRDQWNWISENWSSHGFDRQRIIVGASIAFAVLGFELYAIYSWKPDEFQRLGSVLVALSICLVPYYKSLAEALTQSGHEQQEIGVANHLAHANFASGWLMERIVFLFAVVFATAGTLQWGYGDKIHCLVHGNGWTTC